MKPKKLYIIKGSEDGNLGIAGNIRKALQMLEYRGYKQQGLPYSQICKYLKDQEIVFLNCENNTRAEIEVFYLNTLV